MERARANSPGVIINAKSSITPNLDTFNFRRKFPRQFVQLTRGCTAHVLHHALHVRVVFINFLMSSTRHLPVKIHGTNVR